MLRTIRNDHLYSRLIGLTVDQVSVAAELGTSEPEASVSDDGAGNTTITLARSFARRPVVVGGLMGTALNGGYFCESAIPTQALIKPELHASGGTDTDGIAAVIALGWDSEVTDQKVGHRLFADRLRPRLVAVQINTASSGSINFGHGEIASLSRAGAGDVTLTLARPFQVQPTIGSVVYPVVAVATAITTSSALTVKAHTVTASTVRFQVYDNAPNLADATFNAFILGWDSPEPSLANKSEVMTGQRKPRLIAGSITVTSGVPAVTVGTNDFTVSDTGTGDIGVTFSEKFAREPIVIGSSGADPNANAGARVAIKAGPANTGFNLITRNAGGTAADIASGSYVSFMALGFDDQNYY